MKLILAIVLQVAQLGILTSAQGWLRNMSNMLSNNVGRLVFGLLT